MAHSPTEVGRRIDKGDKGHSRRTRASYRKKLEECRAVAAVVNREPVATMNVAGALPEQGRGVKRSFPRDCEESPRSSHAADAPEVEEQLCELRYASARSALRKAQAEARR